MREWSIQLTRKERDLVMKSLIVTLTSKGDTTKHASDHQHKSPNPHRKQEYTTYMHLGMKVCQTTFLFLHSTGRFVFKSLKKSSREIGMQERIHGNTRKAPHNAFTFDIKHATTFIVNYAEEHAIQLPGRIPGYKRTDLQLLPCSTTKRSVWIQYSAVAAQVHLRSFSYRSFCRIWKELLPNILPTRPLTDLCAVCHQNARLITRSSNLPEEEKSKVMDNCCTTSLS